jgi:uncharacterized protein
MKILLAGGTGFIGSMLTQALLGAGHELIVLTRNPATKREQDRIRYVGWNPEDEGSVVHEAADVSAVINLAGETIIKRWSKRQKDKILLSRTNATQILARSIQRASKPPAVLINASAIGFYGASDSLVFTEDHPAGEGFLSNVCKAWEAHAIRAEDFGVRVVRLRLGVVLGRGGGALEKMLPPFRLFLGGWLGSGNQWMSWIHIQDVVGLILFALERDQAAGPLNATAPEPVTNKVFSMVLAQTLKRPCLAPVPGFVLRGLAGEMGVEVLLKGQRVVPKKSQDLGYSFQFTGIRAALADLC